MQEVVKYRVPYAGAQGGQLAIPDARLQGPARLGAWLRAASCLGRTRAAQGRQAAAAGARGDGGVAWRARWHGDSGAAVRARQARHPRGLLGWLGVPRFGPRGVHKG